MATKLECVNKILRGVKEAPVTALDTGVASPAGIAEAILDEVSEIIQAKGWHENTEHDLEFFPPTDKLTASATGTFVLGETVTQATSGATGTFYQLDGAYIWVKNLTGTFDGTHTITGSTSGATATVSARAATTTGYIPVKSDILRIDSYGTDEWRDVINRGGTLYDKDNNTFVFTGTLRVEVTRLLTLITTSTELRNAIVTAAAVEFQRRYIGGREQDAMLAQEAALAMADLRRMNTDNADINVLDGTTSRSILGYPGYNSYR